MKRFLGIILVIIFFVSCDKSLPKGIFPEQKMVDVFFDMHLADGYIRNSPLDSVEKKKVNFYLSIYQKYKTDSAQVRLNLDYYASHPQKMEEVYAQISKRLKSEEELIQNADVAKHREIFKQDSLAKQRLTDSIHLVQRDSVMHFTGARDLFIKKDTTSKDTTSAAAETPVMNFILNQQKKWEMTFYYFSPSSLPAPRPVADQPNSLLRKEGDAPTERNEKRTPN